MIKKTLAACGVIVALSAAGCSASTKSAAAGSGSNGIPAASPASAPSASAPPAWAAALGSGVTVTDARTAKAGDGSPAGVFQALLKSLKAANIAQLCAVYEPSLQAKCKSAESSVSAAELKSVFPAFKDIVPSYTVLNGDKALVGFTGTVCEKGSSSCSGNTNPAAIFDSGKSFSALWHEITSSDSGQSQNAYSPMPVIKVNGTWYLYTSV